jgi:hypothetical protein
MDLEVKEIPNRAAMPDSDVHVTLPADHGHDEALDVIRSEVQHVAVHEEKNVVSGMLNADTHGETLPMVLAERDRPYVEGSRDLDGLIGRSVAHHDDLIDERMARQSVKYLCNRILFVEGSDDS